MERMCMCIHVCLCARMFVLGIGMTGNEILGGRVQEQGMFKLKNFMEIKAADVFMAGSMIDFAHLPQVLELQPLHWQFSTVSKTRELGQLFT